MVKTDFSQELMTRLVYAGPHREVRGCQMVFVMGLTVVTVADTRWTDGLEVMAWGLFRHPARNLTPERVEKILRKIWERSAR